MRTFVKPGRLRGAIQRISLSACAMLMASGAIIADQANPASATDVLAIDTHLGAFPWRSMNQGWWPIATLGAQQPLNFISNVNAIVGTHNDVESVNFYTFDLRRLTRPVTSVVLRLPTGNQAGVHLHYQLHDVSTPPQQLNMTTGYSLAIARDLAGGVTYGGTDVSDARDEGYVRVQLNAAGVAAVNAARGGYFSVGGRLWRPLSTLGGEHFLFNTGVEYPSGVLRMTLG